MKNIVKLIFSLVLIFVSVIGFAQNNFYLGLNYSIDYNYRILENKSGSSNYNDTITKLDKEQLAKTSNGFGLHIIYEINELFQLEVGYNATNKGYRTENDYAFTYPNPSRIEQIETIYNYRYAEVPVRLNYTKNFSQFILIPSLGITFNSLTNAEIEKNTYYYDTRIPEKKTSNINVSDKSLSYSYYMSFGVAYKLNESLNFRLEPFYSRNIKPISEPNISTWFYSAGVNFGLYLKL